MAFPHDLEAILRRHPEGAPGKYLEPYGPPAREIDRAWEKIAAKAEDMRQAAEKPTYGDLSRSVQEARSEVEAAVLRFLLTADAYRVAKDEEADPPVHALAVTTGAGKTRATANAVAQYILGRRVRLGAARPSCTPCDPSPGQRDRASVCRARRDRPRVPGPAGEDPLSPARRCAMTWKRLRPALALGAVPEKACCWLKTEEGQVFTCPHFHACSYQAQKEGNRTFGSSPIKCSSTPAGLREGRDGDRGRGLSGSRAFAFRSAPQPSMSFARISRWCRGETTTCTTTSRPSEPRLANGLAEHEKWSGTGGVRREHLLRSGLTGDTCTQAIEAVWKLKETDKVAIYPGMPRAERIKAAQAAHQRQYVRAYLSIWKAARELLHDSEAETSGRLYLDHREDEDGRVTLVKGAQPEEDHGRVAGAHPDPRRHVARP